MIDVIMPRLSDTMEEGTIIVWFKRPGDPIERGDVLAEIETDKATVELESFDQGILDRIEVGEGVSVAIGTVVARLRRPDEATDERSPDPVDTLTSTARPNGGAEAATPDPPLLAKPNREPSPAGVTRVRASPLARRVAKDKGIDLQTIAGSGTGGRIVRVDVDRTVAPRANTATDLRSMDVSDDDIEMLSSMRSIVARRMSESVREAPHFYATLTFAAEELLALRARVRTIAETHEGLAVPSINDLIVFCVARTLARHREINASFAEDHIVLHRGIHIGIAVALDGGLIVPVLRDADRKSLSAIAAESRDLSELAREGRLRPEQFRGSTFTVSNLGMFGIDHFKAIINRPEAAILAVGAVRDEPVVRHGSVVPGKVCTLTLSSDHRVIDGAHAARFLAELKSLLEEPLRMLL